MTQKISLMYVKQTQKEINQQTDWKELTILFPKQMLQFKTNNGNITVCD